MSAGTVAVRRRVLLGPYREALPIAQVLEEIAEHAGTQFDPDRARARVALIQEREQRGDAVTLR